jgi:hypothetical protein
VDSSVGGRGPRRPSYRGEIAWTGTAARLRRYNQAVAGPTPALENVIRSGASRILFTGDAHYDYGLELLGAFGEEDFRADVLKPPTMAARAEPGAACSRRQGPPSRSPRPPMRVVTGSRRTHWTGALVAALSALTAQRLLARVRPASWCWQTRGARG